MQQSIFNSVADKCARYLYPWHCQLCRADSGVRTGICIECYASLPWCETVCSICGLPLSGTVAGRAVCGCCQQSKPYFDRLFAPLWYEPPIRELVVNLKYANRWENAPLLMELFLSKYTQPIKGALLLSVPSHPKRIRMRGFNPVRECMRLLHRKIDIEYNASAIKRVRATETQTGKTQAERRRNVKNVFKITQDIAHRKIILFDDVVTTGATVNEVSKCLKNSKASYVEVWAIARTK